MNILILTRISHSSTPYEHWLRCIEPNIYLFCDKTKYDTYSGIHGYCLKRSIEDWRNNETIEVEASEISVSNPFDKLIALSESDIVRAAQIRQHLNIVGQTLESAIAFRDKIKMKNILTKAGIRVPIYRQAELPEDFFEFADEIGFPCVIKPVDGAGSAETYVVNSNKELADLLGKIVGTKKWDIEQYIKGTMYHVDGFIKDGNVKFMWPSRYLNGCLAFQEGRFLGSVVLSHQNRLVAPLLNLAREVLEALPTPKESNFHAEIFVTPDDKLIVCEIASRTGGGRIVDTILAQFGINLLECWVKEACGIGYDIPNEHNHFAELHGFVLIPPVKGTLKLLPETCPLPFMVDYKINSKVGENYNVPQRSVDHVASFIVKGSDEREVEDRINKAVDWFTENCLWD